MTLYFHFEMHLYELAIETIFQARMEIISPIEETMKAMLAWGWTVEVDPAKGSGKTNVKRRVSKVALVSAN